MDYFKKIERSVTISADKRSTVDLQVDVWSQDLNVTKFILKLDTTDSAAIDLTNATVRVAMVYSQDGKDVKIEAAGIVEDVATQKIAYVMDDKLAGFEGLVIAGFYVTLSTGQRIDIQNVTFNMRKSLLDKDLEAAKESYYQTFDDIVADVRQTGDTAKTQINQVLPDVQSEGEKVKTNINAVVSDVNGYADSQKQAINNIVSDVQSTGDTAKADIKATLPSIQAQVSEIKEDLADIENGNKTVDSALNISEKQYGLYGQNIREWSPSYSGSYASMTDKKTLINGNKYLAIAKCNDLSYFSNFGLLINGSWYKTSLGGFNTIPTEKLAYCRLTPDKDDIIPAIIVGNEGVGKSCLAECYVYDITDYDGTVTANFASKVFNKSYDKYSYEDIKNIANGDTWYKGKILTCLGDSWTAQDTFRTRLQNYFGFSRVNNCGVGGTRLTGSGSTAFASDDRINTIPLDTDVLTILGGANDAVYGTIGGGQINFETTDLNSASGALNVILSKIYYKFRMAENGFYPDIDYSGITRVAERKDIKIFIATCCGRYDGENYAKYARMISDGTRDIARLHGLPVVDLARKSGINDMNYASYLGDKIHPSDVGDMLVSDVFINTFLANESHD